MSARVGVELSVLVITSTCLAGVVASCAARSSAVRSDSSHYSADQIDIGELERIEKDLVKITFRAPAETLYYCPGANGTRTESGIELRFVRSSIELRPRVEYPAEGVAGTADRFIVVEAKGDALFLRSGEELLKVFPAPSTESGEDAPSTPNAAKKQAVEWQRITALSSMQLYTHFALTRKMLEGSWDEKTYEQFSFYDGMNLHMMQRYEKELAADETWGPFLVMKNALHQKIYEELRPLVRKRREGEELSKSDLELLGTMEVEILEKLIR